MRDADRPRQGLSGDEAARTDPAFGAGGESDGDGSPLFDPARARRRDAPARDGAVHSRSAGDRATSAPFERARSALNSAANWRSSSSVASSRSAKTLRA